MERSRGSWHSLSDTLVPAEKPAGVGRYEGLSGAQAGEKAGWHSGPDDWTEPEWAARDKPEGVKQPSSRRRHLPSFSKLSFAITGSLSGMFFMWSFLSSPAWNTPQNHAQGSVHPPPALHSLAHPRKLASLASVNLGDLGTTTPFQARQSDEKHVASLNRADPETARPAAEAHSGGAARLGVEWSAFDDPETPEQAHQSEAAMQVDRRQAAKQADQTEAGKQAEQSEVVKQAGGIEAAKQAVGEPQVESESPAHAAVPCSKGTSNIRGSAQKHGPGQELKPAEKQSPAEDQGPAEEGTTKEAATKSKVSSWQETLADAPCRKGRRNARALVEAHGSAAEPMLAMPQGSAVLDQRPPEKRKTKGAAKGMELHSNGEVQRPAAVRGGSGGPQKAQETGGSSNAGGSPSAEEAEEVAAKPAVAASVATGDAKGVPAGLGKSDAAASTSLTLKEAVENVAGPDRMLIMASSTANYLDLAQNLLASAARIGRREKVLMIAEDEEAFTILHRIIPKQTVKGWEIAATELRGSAGEKGTERDHVFFNSVLARRPRYLLAILELNVTLLSSDVDNVFLKNPFEPLSFTGDYDLWLMQDLAGYKRDASWEPVPVIRNVTENYCTALLYMLPNDANKAMLRQLIANIDEHSLSSEKGVFEQTEWNLVLANSTAGLAVRVAALSPFLFPTGCIYFSCRNYLRDQFTERMQGKEWSQVAIVLQNNWAPTHKEKVDRFKEQGMWFV